MFVLDTYEGGKKVTSHKLPFFKLAPGADIFTPATNDSTHHLSIITESDLKRIKVDLHLPAGITSDRALSFTATNVMGAAILGPFELKFPAPRREWIPRDTLVDVELELADRTLRYRAVVFHEKLN